MTTEEKAKVYDEALEKARKELNTCGSLDCDAARQILRFFPQLRKSEDEKTRKELLSFIESVQHSYLCATNRREKWIAYLEKKKERGPLTKEEEYTLHRIIEYLEDETCPSEWISLLHDIYCLPYKKQKEPVVDKEGMYYYLGGKFIYCGYPATEENPYDFAMSQQGKQKENPEEPKIAFGDWGDKEKQEAIFTCLKYMRFIKKITNQEYDDLTKWLNDNLVSNVLEKDGWTIANEQTDTIKEDYYGAFLRGEMRGYLRASKEKKPIKVYRVENEDKQKGLWRKFDGTWEPLFNMLTDGLCKNLPMEDNDLYRAEGKKWFASAPSRETLQKWFSKRDLEELTAAGFTISEFEVTNYKKVSEFEYIFTRDSIVNRTYLTVSDIYPEQKPAECKATINGEPISTENQSVDIPLAEWSEEDEASYNAFMCEVVNEKMNPTIEQIKWLRGIRDKLKSLPSIKKEWSEEDERIIDTIVSVLGQYIDYKTVSGTGSGYATPRYTKEIEWLKSLRPSWKPSKEQMNGLAHAINLDVYDAKRYGLESLYNDLKKLM